MNSNVRRIGWVALPAAGSNLLLGGIWAWVRYGYGPNDPAAFMGAFLGWLGITFLVSTVTGIALACGAKACPGRIFCSAALLLLGESLLVACVGCGNEFVTVIEAAKVCLLLLTWTGLWVIVAIFLSRWGAGIGIGKTMALSMILLAGPVVLAPAARAVSAASPWQSRIAAGIGTGCPLLANLDAMRASVRVEWPQLPHMYAWSGLGQDIPMELPSWSINAGVYAAVAVAVGLVEWMLRRVFRR